MAKGGIPDPQDRNKHQSTAEMEGKQDAFLVDFRVNGNILSACVAADTSRRSVARWREEDESFAQRYQDAYQESTDLFVAEADRRAKDGVSKPVFYKGEECGKIQEYSDRLMDTVLHMRGRVSRDGITPQDDVPPDYRYL